MFMTMSQMFKSYRVDKYPPPHTHRYTYMGTTRNKRLRYAKAIITITVAVDFILGVFVKEPQTRCI